MYFAIDCSVSWLARLPALDRRPGGGDIAGRVAGLCAQVRGGSSHASGCAEWRPERRAD
jgi:hypothetical protein